MTNPAAKLDRILLGGVESAIDALTRDELEALHRIVKMGFRFAPVKIETSEALNFLKESVSDGLKNSCADLGDHMIDYLDRHMQRIEDGLRTWISVQIALRLRQFGADDRRRVR